MASLENLVLSGGIFLTWSVGLTGRIMNIINKKLPSCVRSIACVADTEVAPIRPHHICQKERQIHLIPFISAQPIESFIDILVLAYMFSNICRYENFFYRTYNAEIDAWGDLDMVSLCSLSNRARFHFIVHNTVWGGVRIRVQLCLDSKLPMRF